MAFPVSESRFNQLVEQALQALPEQFARFLEEAPVEVRQRASPSQRRSVGVGRNGLLLGLYHGRPLTQRSVEETGRMPDIIYIFKEDIELACDSEEELVDQVRKTVLHEIGHHFGLGEADLRRLGY